ncbi:hypothetical protein HJ192_11290 [Vibrio parahaemolyticus]|nr:hypothetical protein [Vibrio parahaemolyticus]
MRMPKDSNVEMLLSSRIKVLMAGVLAESLDENNKVNYQIALNKLGFNTDCTSDFQISNNPAITARSDKEKYEELLNVLRCLIYPNATTDEQMQKYNNKLCSKLWDETATYIESIAENITSVATEISKKIIYASYDYNFPSEQLDDLEKQQI